MTKEHPITPPPELVMQWVSLACDSEGPETWIDLATQASRWGADQELEACCEWLETGPYGFSIEATAPSMTKRLRIARRPKPPSLKDEVKQIIDCLIEGDCLNDEDALTLRRALEALPE